jgi:hypothetical protein
MCTLDYTSLRFALEGWVEVGQALPIDNSTCSDDGRQTLMSTVGDANVVKTEAMALSEGYSKSSQNTVKRVVSYAKVRGKYDKEYLHNHTEAMRAQLMYYMEDLSDRIPNANIDLDPHIRRLEEIIHEIVYCISPVNPQYKCKSVTGLYFLLEESYKTWSNMVDIYADRLEQINNTFHRYKQNVDAAYEISSSFYHGKL